MNADPDKHVYEKIRIRIRILGFIGSSNIYIYIYVTFKLTKNNVFFKNRKNL